MLRFLRSDTTVLLLFLAASAGGCNQRCERVCNKLLECGEIDALSTDRYSHQECEQSCQRQSDLIVGWEDEQELEEGLDEHRSCLLDASCEEIEDGVCFDDRFFIVGE